MKTTIPYSTEVQRDHPDIKDAYGLHNNHANVTLWNTKKQTKTCLCIMTKERTDV